MERLTDEQLIKAYIKGDRKALDFLIKRYLTPIFNYALSFAKDRAASEDLTQEIFVKVWKKIKSFNNKYKFKNWIYAIAKNTCLDYLKKNKTINFSELNLTDDNLLFENLIAQAGTPIAEEGDLYSAIGKLPEKHKKIVNLHYYEGFKFREIAKILKQPLNTVKSANRRALAKLKSVINAPK
ncbi:MAG: RNA polymerase sigma factor [bacterium]